MGKVKATEKDDLSAPLRSSRIAKLKIPALKSLPDVKMHPKALAVDTILQKERRHQLRI